ncbi:MAG TPA: aminotransferase class I/II-fold pyridoxal phosphate-dependent enzyme [Actinomycetota bacterium]|nr:aminotransferase class I/II-fold pyridoxal phosphate-dependent enzyme [Actinomycetota bacterium]
MTHLSPGIRAVEPYPFEELDRRVRGARAAGRHLVDLGVGDPRDETPAFIREALIAAIGPSSSYPRAAGLPELRAAVGGWVHRRFGVALDPDAHVLPTLGSKEILFALASYVADPGAGRDTVLVTAPGYPVGERSARFAGLRCVRLPLTEERAFLPDLDAIDEATWARAAMLVINYPNNPTGAVAPISYLRDAAERCRAHDVLLVSDEAYSELWFGDAAPASALQVGDLANVLAVHTLSKRSNMTGYRSGFIAGDPTLIAAIARLRPAVGVTPQLFIQRGSIAAWNDEAHVEASRARYASRRRLFLDVFAEHGIEVAGGDATFYLWVRVPGGLPSAAWASEVLDRADVVVAPGSYFGPEGEGYVRLATVATLEECERAVERLGRMFTEVPA